MCVCVFFFLVLYSIFSFIVVFLCCLCFILEPKNAEGWFHLWNQRIHLCIWAIGGHELETLSIRVPNFLTVHDNSWALKFDNFSEFRNVISDSPPPSCVIVTLCLQKSICDSSLTQKSLMMRFRIFSKGIKVEFLGESSNV